MLTPEKSKPGEILSPVFLGRFPDKELCTELENDFVSDTKMKHNYSKAVHRNRSKWGGKKKIAFFNTDVHRLHSN